MRSALREYAQLMCRYWWHLLIGGCFGVMGAAKDMELMEAPVPSWVWYLLAVGAFVLAQYMSFVTLHKEVKVHRDRPNPNSSLLAIVDYVFEILAKDPNLLHPTEATTNRVIEKAMCGELQIFGTRKNPDEGDGVIEPISSEYWREHSFADDAIENFRLSPNDKAKRMRTTGEGEIYYNLKADSSQVFLCWPQKKRVKLQWPFRREVV